MPVPAPLGDDPGFGPFLEWLLSQGYSDNGCPGHCPYKTEEHAHLHSPGNPASKGLPPRDFILWGDGTSTHFDLTQPAGGHVPVPARETGVAVYDMVLPTWPKLPPWKPLRDVIPRTSRCYQAEAGFMVHVKPECRCP